MGAVASLLPLYVRINLGGARRHWWNFFLLLALTSAFIDSVRTAGRIQILRTMLGL